MPVKKPSVGIRTPKRKDKNGNPFNLDLDSVEAWVNSLPRGSAGKTAQELFSALQDANQKQFHYDDRLDYLEIIREPLFYSMSVMEKHFIGENFPLSSKQKKIADLAKEFCQLMMTGYLISLEDLLDEYRPRRDKDILALLLHRAISYLNHYIRIAYQTYTIVPDNIWVNVHKLYAFAEDYGVCDIKVADEHFQYIRKTSVAGEYVRILLIATASPYHMRNKEAGNLFINIERWIDLVKVYPVSSKVTSRYYYITDLDGTAPVLTANELKGRKKQHIRVIDIDELIHKIDGELHGSEFISSQTLLSANLGEATLSHDLLRRLKQHWTSKPENQVVNNSARQEVKLVVGVSATYNLVKKCSLNGEDESQLFDNLVALKDMVATPIEDKQVDSKNTSNANNVQNLNQDEQWILSTKKKMEMVLQTTTARAQQLQVGEIVGVETTSRNSKGNLLLGIISWLRVYNDNLVKIGIKLISRSAVAIEVKVLSDNGEPEQIYKAFLISPREDKGGTGSLFGLPHFLRSGMTIAILVYGKEVQVRLTQKLADSGLYGGYLFEGLLKQMPKKKNKVQVRKRNISSKSGFEDVWDSI